MSKLKDFSNPPPQRLKVVETECVSRRATRCPAGLCTITQREKLCRWSVTLRISESQTKDEPQRMSSVLHITAKTFWTLHGDTSRKTGVTRRGTDLFKSVNGSVGGPNHTLFPRHRDAFTCLSVWWQTQWLRCQGVAAKDAVCLLGGGCCHSDRSSPGRRLRSYVSASVAWRCFQHFLNILTDSCTIFLGSDSVGDDVAPS